jgi:single-strand DNA-binding protein
MSIECAFFGSLARDAETKTSKNGKTYIRANIRVENGETAQFINCMIFDTDAIAIADKLVKGARAYIEGKLSLDEWTGQDGAKRTGLSCVSWHCRLAQIGRAKVKREQQKQDPPASGRERAARSDFAPSGGGSADMNDDIPFAPEWR